MDLPIKLLALLAAGCFLSACSREPGDAEVQEAIKARIVATEFGPTNPAQVKDFNEKLAKVKVVGCKNVGDKNGFNCDWANAEPFAPFVTNSGRILKTDAGWSLAAAGQ